MKPRLLLISSDFFSYYKLISNEFENQGWDVHFINDRPAQNSLVKILIRKFRFLLTGILDRHYYNLIRPLGHFDLILIIKGEGITDTLIVQLKKWMPSTPIHLYLWDSLVNTPGAKYNIKVVDKVFSFDPYDCASHYFTLLPLFYVEKNIDQNIDDKLSQFDWDLSFVGSIHGDRLKVICDVRKALNEKNNFFVFIFFASRLMLWFRFLFDSSISAFKSNELSLRSLPKAEAMQIFQKSNAVLDIHHANQTGLTMRTLEVLSLGKKLVTTNKTIENYDFYTPEQIHIINRNNPKIDLHFFNSVGDSQITNKIRKYEINNWVRQVSQKS